MAARSAMREVLEELRRMYGVLEPEVTDPFEMLLFENAAYLVDDAKRIETFRALRQRVGLTPAAILKHSAEEIAEAIAMGGMLPLHRAEKVLECAKIAQRQGLDALRRAIADDPKQAKKMLREYPGAGEPLAEKILLFAGVHPGLAPESNALRVLVRLGFGKEHKSYSTMYRSAAKATEGMLSAEEARAAHLLLRRHGQEVCKRSEPRCEVCPLRAMCVWYRSQRVNF